MKFEHMAIWCRNLEVMRTFYMEYFTMISNEKYENHVKKYTSYFLSFDTDSSTRLELMQRPECIENNATRGLLMGYAHLAVSVGGREKVDQLTEKLYNDGYSVVGKPRITGDGYYESIVEDPEGNWIEITE